MKIAMLAPVSWPVPPTGYGPWEQIVFNLTEALIDQGHEVTLFAAPGSKTRAELVVTVPHPFSLWPEAERAMKQRFDDESGLLIGPPDFRALEQMHIAACMEAVQTGAFDLVHSHLHVHALVFSRLIACPMITTLHGSAWVKADHPVLDRYKDKPFVSISNAERTFKPDLNYVATVYNGIDLHNYTLSKIKDDFLLFSGRVAPEKGVVEAIRIAKGAGMKLMIAGMIEEVYRDYFEQAVQPHLDGREVEYIGLLSQHELIGWYQRAKAVVCPIRWAEPFGLVTIEAQACGTPVLGRNIGAFTEIILDGETGFLFDSVDEGIASVAKLDRIDPDRCRKHVEERFSARIMAERYLDAYRRVLSVC